MTQVAEAVSDAMREFLAWVAFRPRTYADAMDAWQSHCPRFTLWEDALDRGLIQLETASATSSSVRLTASGRAALNGSCQRRALSILTDEAAIATPRPCVVKAHE